MSIFCYWANNKIFNRKFVKMKKALFLIILFLPFSVYTQFLKQSELSIVENGNVIKNPLTGGLNSCQLSNIDLNDDGKMDIFVFERVGDRVLCFLNNNDVIGTDFHYSKNYSKNFPSLYNWALLVDYNCDGKEDIFTYNNSYVKVFKNTSQGESLSFQVEEQALISDLGPIQSAIIISEVDIPSFIDIDGDQDIDVLTFKQSGGYVEYHRNLSQELYGNCDSLVFKLETDCWGEFYEGLNTYEFNSCNEDAINNQNEFRSSGPHSGSSTLALDMDGDDDMDLILGDVSFNNLNLLVNGGDNQNANMISVNQNFPIGNGSNVSADISSFPAAFYLDVNNDDIRDLIVSPNTENNSENFESIMMFVNAGEDNSPLFQYTQNDFLQNNTLDFGSGAYPAIIDYNNDGLKDLIIGNYAYFNNSNPSSQIALLINIGSETEPNFEVVDRDFGGLGTIPLDTILNQSVKGIFPTVADLDNDGDIDLIIGDSNGKLHFFKNIAESDHEIEFELQNVNFFNIDIGQHATPFLFDMNGDNLFDLIIGQLDGTISYIENSGSTYEPIFDTIIEDFGGISVNNDESLYGFSTPYIYKEENEINILIGSESGQIYHYRSINNDLSLNFELLSDNFQGLAQGKNTALVYEDFTNDGKRDLFFGMQTGGLFYFVNDSTAIDIEINKENNELAIYPNPANNFINVETNIKSQILIYSSIGQLVLNKKIYGTSTLDISYLSKGYYLLNINQQDYSEWRKIIKN
ncbi:MAG: hypothetical protein CMP70_00910 [Flavobacteriales bacterium]|nr:hypothetical protein [Flavobacteriales bacterium]